MPARLAGIGLFFFWLGCTSEEENYGVAHSALERPPATVSELQSLTDINARAYCPPHYCYNNEGQQLLCCEYDIVSGQREITSKGTSVLIGYPSNGAYPDQLATPWPAVSVSRFNTSTSTWTHSSPVLYGIGTFDTSHEDVAIRIDGDNRIHLWGGMHGNRMWYQRSSTLSPTSSWSGLNLIGNDPNTVAKGDASGPAGYTYPESATSPVTGDVFHISRRECDPVNQSSNLCAGGEPGTHTYVDLFQYKRSNGTWSKVATVFSGYLCGSATPNGFGPYSGTLSLCQEGGVEFTPYLPDLIVDSQGQVHIAVLWQQGGGAGARHPGTYIRYDPDGGGFYKADGTNVTGQLPITTTSKDAIWQWQPRQLDWDKFETMVDMRFGLDAADRPIIGYSISPDAQRTPYQARVATWTGQKWERITLSEKAHPYTIVTPIYSAGLARAYFQEAEPSSQTRVYQSYYDGQFWSTGQNVSIPGQNNAGLLQSLTNRDSSQDLLLMLQRIVNVQFTLPSPAPTRMLRNATADSYVRAGIYDDDNFGTVTGISVKNYLPTNDNTRIVYLKFTLPTSGLANVRRARLKMYANELLPSPVSVTAYAVGDGWQENAITWNNRPTFDASPVSLDALGTAYIGAIGHEYIWDVTGHVQSAFATDKVVSIALWVASNSVNTAATFHSREASTFKPVLVLDGYPSPPIQEATLYPTHSAMVKSGSYADQAFPTSNLFVHRAGSDDGLDLRNCNQATFSINSLSYARFDLATLPQLVNRAILRMPKVSQTSTSIDVTAYMAPDSYDSNWDQPITWNSRRPCQLGDAIDTTASISDQSYVEFDVTPYVNKEGGGNKILTIALYRTNSPNSGWQIEYDRVVPILTVTY